MNSQQKAEMVLAALDGRHQLRVACYCGCFVHAAVTRDYSGAEVNCLLCGRRWRRCGTETWSYWHMVDKRGRFRYGLRGKEVFIPQD